MKPRLSVITLGVKDFSLSLKFYRDGLGWPTKATENDDIAFLNLGGIVLSLYPYEKLAEDATVKPDGSGFNGITLAYNTASEKEVEEILIIAERAGAKIIKPAQKVFWGGYSGYFADPDGYLWEVAYNPFWKMNDKGEPIYNDAL